MKLFGYWRSSAAYRVRIALYLKGVPFENIPVHLVKNGGEQHSPEYVELNPTHLVPTLVDGELTLNQSLAILEYLDEKFPNEPLIHGDIGTRSLIKALSYDIACEIHPVNNLRIQQYLVKELGQSEDAKLSWSHHWMKTGFAAIEKKLEAHAGLYCFGDSITLADLCLVPQVYNANRFNVDMSAFPIINRIVEQCNTLPAFQQALPENQPDAQK